MPGLVMLMGVALMGAGLFAPLGYIERGILGATGVGVRLLWHFCQSWKDA